MQIDEALSLVREIPDFPEAGILFKDITPLLSNPQAMALVTDHLAGDSNSYTHVVGIEARGFIFGAAISTLKQRAFVPFRKSGKLPYQTISKSYGLEYGSDVIEAHIDALKEGDRVLLIDDVLATGGTIIAAIELIKELGAHIEEVVVLYEISFLKGRERIQSRFPELRIRSIVAN